MKLFFKFTLFPITSLILSLLFTAGLCKTTSNEDGCGSIIIILGPLFLLTGFVIGIIYVVASTRKTDQEAINEENTTVWKNLFGIIVGVLFAAIGFSLIKFLFSFATLKFLSDLFGIGIITWIFTSLSLPLTIFLPCFGFYLGLRLVTKKNT